jgi:hypothetical protein
VKETRLITLASVLMVFGFTPSSFATPIELVVNGNFESPYVSAGSWSAIPNGSVSGWTNSSGLNEIWGSSTNYDSMPLYDRKGNPVGQNHELTYLTSSEVTTQTMIVTGSNGIVDLSFDTWKRTATQMSYSLTGSTSGTLASGTYTFPDANWDHLSFTNLPVAAGETLTLSFQSLDGSGSGAHIDNVSVLYDSSPAPEPSSTMLMGLSGLGIAGMEYIKRHKSSNVA